MARRNHFVNVRPAALGTDPDDDGVTCNRCGSKNVCWRASRSVTIVGMLKGVHDDDFYCLRCIPQSTADLCGRMTEAERNRARDDAVRRRFWKLWAKLESIDPGTRRRISALNYCHTELARGRELRPWDLKRCWNAIRNL